VKKIKVDCRRSVSRYVGFSLVQLYTIYSYSFTVIVRVIVTVNVFVFVIPIERLLSNCNVTNYAARSLRRSVL